jgi:phosphate acetyltransferase
MSKNIYIATMEPRSGKSVVILGLMEMLSRRMRKIAIFRPIVQAGKSDDYIELVQKRYKLKFEYEELYGCTHQEARDLLSSGQHEEAVKRIVDKYKALEQRCDFVVCVGTDFTGVATAFEFDFNADIANQMGCPLLLIVNGFQKSPEDVEAAVRMTREAYLEQECTVVATVANRVEEGLLDEMTERLSGLSEELGPVYVFKEEPGLAYPSVGTIARSLHARFIIGGDSRALDREVRVYKVAAMQLRNFLSHLQDGALVIAPGDRADVILGTLMTLFSENAPRIAGLMLTGGLEPEPHVLKLIEGIKKPSFPIMLVETDTYTTAMNVSKVHSIIYSGNERKIALALGLFESRVDLTELEKRIDVVRSTRRTPLMFEYDLIERAKSDRQHIVLPEGDDERILRAAEILLRRRAVDVTLLGEEGEIQHKISHFGLDLHEVKIIDPVNSPRHEDFSKAYYELRKHKGMHMDVARDTLLNVSYFGTMMVHKGMADGMVSGAAHTTQHTLRPAFEFIRTKPGYSIVSSVFLMCLADRVLVYGDCAVNPNPNPGQLADIAIASAETAQMFGIQPRIAMLSYSTGESGIGEDVEKVREATQLAKERRPDLLIEGPIQYDAAIDRSVAAAKMPDSKVAGHATVFIFPDLNTGNNTYKAVQRSANAVAIGPVLQGLNKPVNDLSRGCTVADIVNTVAITAIQAQALEKKS